MSGEHKISSLLSPQATGGDIAEGGFQYQANLIAVRIPDWLSQDGFSEMTRESLGDVEAKFFVPNVGLVREFVEYKNHRLTPSELWPEVEHFYQMDQAAPGSYRRFVLACTGVSDNLSTMINALNRVRGSYSFYDDAPSIQDASFNEFAMIVKALDKSRGLAKFIFMKVRFEIDLTDAEDHPRELFREALLKNFAVFDELQVRIGNLAYSRLVELLRFRKNRPIYRCELEKALWNGVAPEAGPRTAIRIHTSHECSSYKGPHGCLAFDWTSIFGGAERCYPLADEWNLKVLDGLKGMKCWILSTDRPRLIHLSGNRRLSASIAVGSVFSSVSGFVIEMETKDGLWSTNSYPTDSTPDYPWICDFRDGGSIGEIAVGVGVKKEITTEVEQFLADAEFCGSRLYLIGNSALLSDDHANRAVDRAKERILEVIARTKARKMLLFVAGPTQLAVFLGHRLNATCTIQCYERKKANVYVPTCLIST